MLQRKAGYIDARPITYQNHCASQRAVDAASGPEGCGALRDCQYLLHDRDAKYGASFRAVIETGRVKIQDTGVTSSKPKSECLLGTMDKISLLYPRIMETHGGCAVSRAAWRAPALLPPRRRLSRWVRLADRRGPIARRRSYYMGHRPSSRTSRVRGNR